ncbi:MAG: sulfite exporter TauE/SafE family protein [Pseudomonadota bacterium]
MTFELFLFAFAVYLFAGVIKGTIGIGLPTITISILAQLVDPRIAISFLLLPALVTNSWQIYRGGLLIKSLQTLWPFGLTLMVVLYFSSLFAPAVPVRWLVFGIGIMVVLWTVTTLLKSPPKLPDRYDKPVQFFAGVVGGISGGLTAIWSPPMVVYLHSRQFEIDVFVAYTGFLIMCGTIPLVLGYATNGILTRELLIGSALMIVPTLIGFSVGEKLRSRISGPQFHRVVLIIFCLMGLNMIRRGVLG